MAWTTPASYTTSEVVTASKLNTHLRDNLAYLKAVLDGTQTQAWSPRYAAADAVGASVVLGKARGASLASPAIVSASDSLGTLGWAGYDGSAYREAVQLKAYVDGTPGASDMPGALSILTSADGGITLTERVRVNAAGQALFASGAALLPSIGFLANPDAGLNYNLTGPTIELVFDAGAFPGIMAWTPTSWTAQRGSIETRADQPALQVYGLSGQTEVFPILDVQSASGGTRRFAVHPSGNVAIGSGTGGFGSGLRVMAIQDAATVPTTNPAGGALLYSEAGILKTRTPGGVIRAIGGAGVRVYNTTIHSIATATDTILGFNSERFDTDAFHDTATNNSFLTVPAGLAGKYLIWCNIQWNVVADATMRQVRLLYNGTTIIGRTGGPGLNNATFGTEQNVAIVYTLAAGDYVQVQVRHERGSSLDILSGSAYSPEFGMQLIG